MLMKNWKNYHSQAIYDFHNGSLYSKKYKRVLTSLCSFLLSSSLLIGSSIRTFAEEDANSENVTPPHQKVVK